MNAEKNEKKNSLDRKSIYIMMMTRDRRLWRGKESMEMDGWMRRRRRSWEGREKKEERKGEDEDQCRDDKKKCIK